MKKLLIVLCLCGTVAWGENPAQWTDALDYSHAADVGIEKVVNTNAEYLARWAYIYSFLTGATDATNSPCKSIVFTHLCYTNGEPTWCLGWESGATNRPIAVYRFESRKPTIKYPLFDNADDQIRDLCKRGEVCRVVGHMWIRGCGMLGCAVYHSQEHRHCTICGRVEPRKERWE